jgi:steroid delta-isomerase-like uncharacterized protein
VPPLLVAWAEAWSSGEPEKVAALYGEESVYEEVPTGSVARGPDEIREFVAATYATFPTVTVTPRNGFRAEGWSVLEGDFSAVSADGKPVSVPFMVVMELDGDVIRRSADYFDLHAVLTQLEAAAETATPAA